MNVDLAATHPLVWSDRPIRTGVIDGWRFVTDYRMCVAVEVPEPALDEGDVIALGSLLALDARFSTRVRVESLREWAAAGLEYLDCPECDGSGWWAEGAPCAECAGTGRGGLALGRGPLPGGTIVDRHLVAYTLDVAEATGDVVIGETGPESAVILRPVDLLTRWRAWLMPARSAETDIHPWSAL